MRLTSRFPTVIALSALGFMLVATPVQQAAAQASYFCAGAPTPHLVIGGIAIVTPGAPNNLRQSPSLSAPIVTQLAQGTQMAVSSGPICAGGYSWWQVQQAQTGTTGWIAEGHTSTYYVQPFASPVTATTSTYTLPAGKNSANVAVDGISFLYNGFAGPTVQMQHSLDYWGYVGGWPGWVESYQFTFGSKQYILAHLTIVKNGVQFFGQTTMTDLAKHFQKRLALLSNKPIDYYIHTGLEAAQLFHAQEAYKTFPNLLGLRFITEYVQAFAALDGTNLQYEFFGVTNDYKSYVWAEFEVSTGLLSNNPLPPNYNPTDDPNFGIPGADTIYLNYVAQTRATLQQGTPQNFQVAVGANGQATAVDLDQMIGSIAIAS